ncbi:MAG TPA: glycosyltransferase family 4 protein [Acidimicrobiales bacterium]|nr:glycosyltransferase family 4 protein [Acidimicrobiales bacterium]
MLLAIKSLGHGGAERLLVDTAAKGDHRAFDYEVAFVLEAENAFAGTIVANGTKVHGLGARGDLDLRWMAAFRRLLIGDHFDIVHFHLPYTAALGRLVIASLPRRMEPVTLYTEHSLWNKVSPPVKILNRATIGHDRALIAVSQAAYDALPRTLKPRARVVVHGVDLSLSAQMIARRAVIRANLRSELGVPPGELLAVTVAGLRREKGYDVLLDAAALSAEHQLPIRFVAAGAGSLDQELAERHRALGLGERFQFLGHRLDGLALLTAADVVVLASHQEGLPVVLMEATSVGAAIVATSVGGVPQVITDGENGLLVPPGDPGRLVDALARLSADPELRYRLGRQAMAGSAEFDVARASHEIEDIYLRLLTERR